MMGRAMGPSQPMLQDPFIAGPLSRNRCVRSWPCGPAKVSWSQACFVFVFFFAKERDYGCVCFLGNPAPLLGWCQRETKRTTTIWGVLFFREPCVGLASMGSRKDNRSHFGALTRVSGREGNSSRRQMQRPGLALRPTLGMRRKSMRHEVSSCGLSVSALAQRPHGLTPSHVFLFFSFF